MLFGSEALASLFWCSKNRNVKETFNGAEAPFPVCFRYGNVVLKKSFVCFQFE